MSQPAIATIEPAASRPTAAAPRRSTARAATGLLVLVSFILTAVLQHVTQEQHHELVKNTGAEAKLDNLNSFSLALLLGGLRGPLVMLLWTSSETQKQDKDLDDFGSKIELIRLLQPEYDSVHLFQMWNLAYNISVQMANKSNKYATIIDAVEYGYGVNRSRPNDINIIAQIGQLFFDKLGGSAEKAYYTERVRRESFPDVRITLAAARVKELDDILRKTDIDPAQREAMVAQARKSGRFTVNKLSADAIKPLLSGPGVTFEMSMPNIFSDTGRRLRLDPMLDLDGKILEPPMTPTASRPAGLAGEAEWNNGAALQYVPKFAPYPYGVPPMALGYEYYKQAQVLKDSTHQKHLQLSDLVIDNRPAITLKLWGEAEWAQGRSAEVKALGGKPSEDRGTNELPTADLPLTTTVVDRAAAEEAIYHYDLAAKLADESEAEYARHQRRYASSEGMFRSHRDSVRAMKWLVLGDADYLRAMLSPTDRERLSAQTADHYTKALYAAEVVMLKYYVDDRVIEQVLGKITKESLETKLTAEQMNQAAATVAQFLAQNRPLDINSDDRHEAERYIKRAFQRLSHLGATPK